MKKTIYLDYAAATPMDERVQSAMQPYFAERFYNPSATYLSARGVSQDIQRARQQLAHHLGCRSSEITFTAGGTEANNLAIRGVMQRFPDKNMVVSAIEHDSVIKPAEQYKHRIVPVSSEGIIDLTVLVKLIDDDTVLVSIMYANNEIGSIQPIKQVAASLQSVRKQRQKSGNQTPLYLHADACQAAAYLDLHTSRLGVDMMTINGGKIYGPKQSGMLYIRSGVEIAPLIYGGGQERGLRNGTENVAGIIGLAEALDLVQSKRSGEEKRVKALQKLFFDLLETKIPGVIINGTRNTRLVNNVHITIPGKDNERIMMELDERGIMCAVGSACSASSDEPSHVLKAIGLSDEDAQSSLRFSMGNSTTTANIETVVRELASLL